jgi:ATP-dependent DNA helicase RecG
VNLLQEDGELEVKRATGKDGRGELPQDFFKSYSAMANTDGGIILLGIAQVANAFEPVGIVDEAKVLKSLWDGLNNLQRVSKNILKNDDVIVKIWNKMKIIEIRIPRASRKDRPIFCGVNPLKGTYLRNFEGDYLADEAMVKRMLADQLDDAPDSRILPKFGLKDIELESLKSYRNQFASSKPDHPFLTGTELDFMQKIGGWNRDRSTNEEGLTLAGLLMFGKFNSIREACPFYFVDYQEKSVNESNRWLDRIEPDGTWSGNLYDFYRRVILKLFEGLKVPFSLRNETRVDHTPIHEALREALVNTLIHADFAGRASILIVKAQGYFLFRNPGPMRISIEDAIRGGITDARNRVLQNMFKLIGAGEQAGSGVPKIFSAWRGQHWRPPFFNERREAPENTTLEMKMVSLLPQEIIEKCQILFGSRFNQLSELERIVLVTAASEQEITNAQIRFMTGAHPADLSKILGHLVKGGYLTSSGPNRHKKYLLNTGGDGIELVPPTLDVRTPNIGGEPPTLDVRTPNIQ